jgi:hypothetical protein
MHGQRSQPAPAAVSMQAALSCWVQGQQRATSLQQTETQPHYIGDIYLLVLHPVYMEQLIMYRDNHG